MANLEMATEDFISVLSFTQDTEAHSVVWCYSTGRVGNQAEAGANYFSWSLSLPQSMLEIYKEFWQRMDNQMPDSYGTTKEIPTQGKKKVRSYNL